jgi:hypothetical protein
LSLPLSCTYSTSSNPASDHALHQILRALLVHLLTPARLCRCHVFLHLLPRHRRVTVRWTYWRVALQAGVHVGLRLRCACAHDIRPDSDVFMADEVCGHSRIWILRGLSAREHVLCCFGLTCNGDASPVVLLSVCRMPSCKVEKVSGNACML